jgi:sugar/nucleoside kinase (ribokinase family)
MVGDDWQGELALKLLKEANIDVSYVNQFKNSTNQCSFIIVNEYTGERTIITHPMQPDYSKGDYPKEAAISGKMLYLDSSGGACALEIAEWAKGEGIPIIMDIERTKDKTPQMLSLADIVIASENFAQEQCPGKDRRDFLLFLSKTYNPRFSGVTLGEKGSLGYINEEFISVPAFPVKVVDTTGAGDVYHAAFAYGALNEWDVEYIMKFSTAAAALKCQRLGGRKGAPTFEEVTKFLESQNL